MLAIFSISDGLQGKDFNYGAFFIDSKGFFYFGGTNGYNKFHPEAIKKNSSQPRLSLNSILIPKKRIESKAGALEIKNLVITHKDYFVNFAFSVIDFLDPEKNQYRYKLDNFDPDWIENGNRNTATYTNLPAGNYVFRVQGANSAGIWNREGISLNVTVLPAPWFTWWAFCGYALLLSVTAWLLRRAYDSYAVERKAQEMAVRMHATEERADDDLQEQLESQDELIKSMYRHNTTTLSLISDYISIQENRGLSEYEQEGISENIQRVGSLSMLEECLHFHDNTLCADLHKFADMLISRLISCSSARPETITTINRVSSTLVAVEMASPIAVVMHELLKNSFQHAFEPDSTANYLQIDFNLLQSSPASPAFYQLTVIDSGEGMPGIIDINNPATTGLAIIKLVADRMGADLQLDTKEGTAISLKIPVSKGLLPG
jgi:two-component sensor histidine kinase